CRTRRTNVLGGRNRCIAEVVERGELRFGRLDGELDLVDRKAGDVAAVIAAHFRQWQGPAAPSAGRARPQIARKIVIAVRRKYSGVDIGIAVVPETDAVSPDRVIVDVVIGERPEQRTNPSISAVAVLPPSASAAALMPA